MGQLLISLLHLGIAAVGSILALNGNGHLALVALDFIGKLLDSAKSAFQTPLDEIDARGTQAQTLLAGDGGGGQPSILSKILGRHQGHLEIILDQDTGDKLRFGDRGRKRARTVVPVLGFLDRRRDGRQFAHHLGDLVRLERDAQLLAVLGAEHFDLVLLVCVERKELGLQTHHVMHLAVDKDDDGGGDFFDEFAVLNAVDVRGEGEFLHRAPARDHHFLGITTTAGAPAGTGNVARHDGLDGVRLLHDVLGHGALDAVTGDDDAVLLARRPPLQQLAADAVLEHTGRGEHDAAADVLEAVDGLQ